MNPERWKRIKRIAADAMERDERERTAFVRRAAGDDSGVADEVLRLLAASGGEDSLLDRSESFSEPGSTMAVRHRGPDTADTTYPAELIERGARRLGTLALLYAAGLALAYVTYEFIVHVAIQSEYVQRPHTPGQFMGAMFIGLGLWIWRIASRRTWPPHRLVRLANVFQVAGSLGIALVSYSVAWDLQSPVWGVSWICVWIILFPMVIPGPPRQAALAAFGAAAMGPIALLIWGATREFTYPPFGIALATTLPNFLCAALAWFGSRYIYRIGLELRAARQLGRYRLVSRIGRGGMGEVWIAEHDMLARPAALKLVRPELMRRSGLSSEALALFEREAQSTAALSSPHTVNLYDFGVTDDDVFYYVMELLDGLDLDVLVRRHGPVSPGRAVHYLVQACDSLGEAHARGLVHRDIKPSNLFTCRQGLACDFIKVLDFGIVKPSTRNVTQAAADASPGVEGTPGWIAPEAAALGVADARTDLYALGCVGYWLLTGRRPFEARASNGGRTDAVPAPSTLVAGVPAGLDEAIMNCLSHDPAARPSSASELASRLLALECDPWTPERAVAWWEQHEHAEPTVAPQAV